MDWARNDGRIVSKHAVGSCILLFWRRMLGALFLSASFRALCFARDILGAPFLRSKILSAFLWTRIHLEQVIFEVLHVGHVRSPLRSLFLDASILGALPPRTRRFERATCVGKTLELLYSWPAASAMSQIRP